MGTGWLKPSQGAFWETNLESVVTLPLVRGDLSLPPGKSPFRAIASVCIHRVIDLSSSRK